jgi:hypothetical protein
VLRAQEIASNSKVPQKQPKRLALPTLFEILVTATVVVETFNQLEQIAECRMRPLARRRAEKGSLDSRASRGCRRLGYERCS